MDVEFEQFDFLHMIRRAYERAFLQTNVRKSFEKAGIWPLNTLALLGSPRPESADNPDNMMSYEALKELVIQKREEARRGDFLQPVVVLRGVLLTTYGLLVTGDEAMQILSKKAEKDRLKSEALREKEENSTKEEESRRLKKRGERKRFEIWAMNRRAVRYGEHRVHPRPMKVRIAIAKHRTSTRENLNQ